MAMHYRILAWKVLWTEEPGGPQSMGSKELDTTEQVDSSGTSSCAVGPCSSALNAVVCIYQPQIPIFSHSLTKHNKKPEQE